MHLSRYKLALMAIVVVAFLVRWSGTFDYSGYFFDENVHIPSALSLIEYGTPSSGHWSHPPFGDLLLCGALKLFGNNPYGWRILNVIVGTASVPLFFFVVNRIYAVERIALFASAVLAVDPFHAWYSRTMVLETIGLFFFLMYLYYIFSYIKTSSVICLCFAGISSALAISSKGWYFVIMIVLFNCYALYKGYENKGKLNNLIVEFLVLMFIMPLSIYLLSFIVWFGRGFSLFEFMQMQSDALWRQKTITESAFDGIQMLRLGGKPWEWFLKPVVFGYNFNDGPGFGRFILEINNFPIRMLLLPSAVLLAYYAWKYKRYSLELTILTVLVASYVPLLFAGRPVFSYSALALLPLAYLCITRAIDFIAEASGYLKHCYAVLSVCLLIWGGYTFPLYSLKPVPLWLYQPVLSITKFVEVNH